MAELADGATTEDVLAFLTGRTRQRATPDRRPDRCRFLSPGESQTLPIGVRQFVHDAARRPGWSSTSTGERTPGAGMTDQAAAAPGVHTHVVRFGRL